MKISIVTVVYNSAATIVDTLNSVAAQSYGDIEHIVIDGCSTDGTLDLLRMHGARVNRLLSEPDRGIYDAMNKGIRLATGDVIGFLNADDCLAHSDVVKRIAETMRNPVDACYGDLVYVQADDMTRIVRYWKSREYSPGLCAKGWMPAHPTFYAKRQVYDAHGGFDLRYKLQSDFEMSLRLLDVKGISTSYVREVLVKMRMGGASNGSLMNIIRGNIEAAHACKAHGFDGGFGFLFRKLQNRIPQFVQRPS